jgi:hypothetical protein
VFLELDGVQFDADDEGGVVLADAAVDFGYDFEDDAGAVGEGAAVGVGAVVGGGGEELG